MEINTGCWLCGGDIETDGNCFCNACANKVNQTNTKEENQVIWNDLTDTQKKDWIIEWQMM